MSEIDEGTTLLQALESSISAPATQAEPVTQPVEGIAAPSTAAPAVDPDAIDPSYSPGAQERIRALIAERNTEREKAAAAAQFEPWKPLIDRFVQEGKYKSFAEFEADQQRIQAEQQQQQQIQQTLSGRANAIMRQVTEGVVDPNTGERTFLDMASAERLFELEKKAALTDIQISNQQERFQTLELEQLRAKPEYANMDAEWVRAVAKANPGMPIEKIAAASHQKETQREQQVLAKYNGGKLADAASTAQQPASGGSGPVVTGAPDPATNPEGYIRWMDAQAAANKR